MSSNAKPNVSADEALLRLKAGNERFVAGNAAADVFDSGLDIVTHTVVAKFLE